MMEHMSRTIDEVSRDIRMAHMKSVQMPGFKDRDIEEKAKKKVKEEYGYSEDNPRFWKIVRTIYENMGGT